MVASMSDKIRLVLLVPESTRKALRIEAPKVDLDMSDVAELALNYVLKLMAEGKTPSPLDAAIKQRQREREADKTAEKLDRSRPSPPARKRADHDT